MHRYYLNTKNGIDISVPSSVSADDLMKTMLIDNKKTGKGISFVLLNKPGVVNNPEGNFMTKVDTALVNEMTIQFCATHGERKAA
jgi:3-dehydroquinate synthetase